MIPRVRAIAIPESPYHEADALKSTRPSGTGASTDRSSSVEWSERRPWEKQTWDRYSGIAAGFAGWRMAWQISSSTEAMNSGVLRAFVISPTFTGSPGFGRLDLDWIGILPQKVVRGKRTALWGGRNRELFYHDLGGEVA
jgi:hypothetical protein